MRSHSSSVGTGPNAPVQRRAAQRTVRFTWYWLADLCARENIAFGLGHALYMKAIHGGKAKNDKIDAHKIAVLLRGGMIPMAYVYPRAMRSTRDLLRRRCRFARQRAALLAHIQNTTSQYDLPPLPRRSNLAWLGSVTHSTPGHRERYGGHAPAFVGRLMYQRINDYGLIGNLGSCALVGLNGSIDWCCLPHLESPAVFCAILDHARGGRFRVAPEGDYESSQRYEPESNILQTEFHTGGGVVRLTDFMPFNNRPDDSHRPVIYRRIEGVSGTASMALEFAPRFDYARAETRLAWDGSHLRATDGRETLHLALPFARKLEGATASARFAVSAGEQLWLVLSHGMAADGGAAAELALANTRRGWNDWVHHCNEKRCVFGGPWHDQVVRSALALKLLTHGETGSLAAAATASLPEGIGGQRNWDYRFCWVRDSSFTVQALHNLGHVLEGEEFLLWVCRVMSRHLDPSQIQIMYGLHGETDLAEQELHHLEGYRESRPVRIGNGAAGQRQLDIYGELMDAAWQLWRYGHGLDPVYKALLVGIADYVCAAWRGKDAGIWEVRGGEQHFVYSKVMCWVALDRALRLHERYGLPGNVTRWRSEAGAIRRTVLSEGYDGKLGAFVQAFGSKSLDASSLLIPLMGFVPFEDPRVQNTINATIRDLSHGALVHRYRVEDTNDGLGGAEGAFLLCSFWLVDCLTLSGRVEEARERFRTLQGYANHLGLYAEEADPATGEMLGNFPQAFTHIGFINSALYLGRAHGRVQMGPAPLGARDTALMKLKKLLLRMMMPLG